MFLIPIVASIFYLIGGQGLKIARWLVGLPIFFIAIFSGADWYAVFAVFTYWGATSIFSYGDNMWTSKLFGRWVSMGISGLMFGLASIPILGLWLGLAQGIFSMIAFLILKYLDDTDKLKNPFQELLRGFLGTLLYVFR